MVGDQCFFRPFAQGGKTFRKCERGDIRKIVSE